MEQPLSQSEILRTSMIVGAIWILVTTSSTALVSLVSFSMTAVAVGSVVDSYIINLLIGLAGTLFSAVFLGCLPAWLIVRNSRRWALRLADSPDSEMELRPSLLLGPALLVLGIYFGVLGAVYLTVNGVSVVASIVEQDPEWKWVDAAGAAASSLVYLICGFLVYRAGSRSVLHAA